MTTSKAPALDDAAALLARLDELERAARSLDEDHAPLNLRDTAEDAVTAALAPHGGDELGEDTAPAVLAAAVRDADDALAQAREDYSEACRHGRPSRAWPQDWTSRIALGL